MFFKRLKISSTTEDMQGNNIQEKEHDKTIRKFLKNILGCRPKNILLYKVALIHKSSSHIDSRGYKVNNERLEYLGDTVLSTIVGDFLFKKYPHQGEGFLTEFRARLVSRTHLNSLAKKIGLSDIMEYNRKGNSNYISMGGDAFEAIVGAIYLDKGYDYARKIIIDRIFKLYVDVESLEHIDWNFKSKIIDWGQKTKHKITYNVEDFIEESSSRKQYRAELLVDEVPQQSATASSIRMAEQLASEKTFKDLVEKGIIDPKIVSKY
ncbi:MAG: hypothetical protein IJ180_03920 [Bacteroidales bacterium]|nr:hypothetical protein [Bacteroidales bacterium]